VDRVREVILKYRNDAFPKVAVTVDLLTTGIDVPSITNLLFVRRVNSRILYEQMLGRATRRCDEIGKETFRIFDAVGLYESLESVTSMKPVVVNQSITFTQLFEELQLESAAEHVQVIIDQIIVKLRRAVKKMPVRSIDAYQMAIGESAEETIERLRTTPPREIKEWASTHKNIGLILDWRPEGESDTWIPISNHADELISVTSGYGNNQRPEDYLQSFESFVRNNVNDIMALNVVVQRPRELTRTQLKELRLALDRQGFSEVALRRAWDEASNKDVAASIIGFVRQAALGDPLIPYEDRVRGAIDRLLAGRAWTEIQRKWLKRIGAQFAKEFIVDRESIDSDQFKIDTGGFKRLDKVFDGKLESVLADFNEELWRTGT
jgi:type I restriction enzyme R subunit